MPVADVSPDKRFLHGYPMGVKFENLEKALSVNDHDTAPTVLPTRRFSLKSGQKYFADSEDTVVAERKAHLHPSLRGVKLVPIAFVEVFFKGGTKVASLLQTAADPSCSTEFEQAYGVMPADALKRSDPPIEADYVPSRHVAAKLNLEELAGVEWESVRKDGGHCLAIYSPLACVDQTRSLLV